MKGRQRLVSLFLFLPDLQHGHVGWNACELTGGPWKPRGQGWALDPAAGMTEPLHGQLQRLAVAQDPGMGSGGDGSARPHEDSREPEAREPSA